jgi:hypothetical protein
MSFLKGVSVPPKNNVGELGKWGTGVKNFVSTYLFSLFSSYSPYHPVSLSFFLCYPNRFFQIESACVESAAHNDSNDPIGFEYRQILDVLYPRDAS